MHTPNHFLIWTMYLAGIVLHLFSTMYLTLSSKANTTAGQTYLGYLHRRAVPIIARVFLSVCLFPIVWDNPKLFDIDSIVSISAAQWGVAGLIGWFSDSLFDKLLTLIPFLRKELPVINGDTPTSGNDAGKP